MTPNQIISLQQYLKVEPDGFWGPISTRAAEDHLLSLMPDPNPWPHTSEAALTNFYGRPGDESQLINLTVPVPLKYEGTPVRTIRCHRKVGASLTRVLIAAYNLHPEVIENYDGCYNFRTMRGSNRPSLHARGAAIDFAAEFNGNVVHWPTAANMPFAVMECFAKEGWVAAGAFWSRDAMHFQATRP